MCHQNPLKFGFLLGFGPLPDPSWEAPALPTEYVTTPLISHGNFVYFSPHVEAKRSVFSTSASELAPDNLPSDSGPSNFDTLNKSTQWWDPEPCRPAWRLGSYGVDSHCVGAAGTISHETWEL